MLTGLYFDVVKFLLTAIFNLQEEEELEEQELENKPDANKGTVLQMFTRKKEQEKKRP